MKAKKTMLVVGLVIALGLYGFFAFFESFEEMRDLGWSSAARRNPYLAAALFLEREGFSVQSADQFEKLGALPKKGILLISNSSGILSSKRLEALMTWMKNGGHLIVAAGDSEHKKEDRLLKYFSIETRAGDGEIEGIPKKPQRLSEQLREMNEALSRQVLGEQNKGLPFEESVPEDEQTMLVFDDLQTTLTAHFLQDRTLDHPYFDWEGEDKDFEGYRPFYWQGDASGVHFLQIQVEQGRLSVLSDARIWQSTNIAYFDHAFLLRVLADDAEEVLFLYGMNVPSLFARIWQQAPEFVFSALIWLLAWFFYRGRRFVPVKEVQMNVRRSMAEHVSASAAYFWRSGFYAQLLFPLQETIEKRACRVLFPFANLDKEDRLKSLSTQSGLGLSEIEKAMSVGGKHTEADFIQTVACLQKIRRSL